MQGSECRRPARGRAAAPLALFAALVVGSASAADGVEAWAAKLRSAKASEWRVAQAYLAHAGVDALPELERLASGADDTLKQRLKETINLMLRNSTDPAAIRKCTRLWAVAQAEWKTAAEAMKRLAGSERYDSGELGLRPPDAPRPPLSPPRQAVADLLALRGFAVPAALELLADKQPGSRMFGVEILFALNAVGQYPAVRKRLDDAGPIDIWHGDYNSRTTVGRATAEKLKSGLLRPASAPDEKHAQCLAADNYADWLDIFAGGPENRFELVNRLRQEAGTLEAKSWDDYWQRAKPVLEAAWDRR